MQGQTNSERTFYTCSLLLINSTFHRLCVAYISRFVLCISMTDESCMKIIYTNIWLKSLIKYLFRTSFCLNLYIYINLSYIPKSTKNPYMIYSYFKKCKFVGMGLVWTYLTSSISSQDVHISNIIPEY